MFTLKIRQEFFEHDKGAPAESTGETEVFIQADRVLTHGSIVADNAERDAIHSQWARNDSVFYDFCSTIWERGSSEEAAVLSARLIEVRRGVETEWYLASKAWLMEKGDTIERIAP